MGSWTDKVALVTGGASGIGRALCARLGAGGARVAVTDIDGAGAEKVAGGIRSAGGRAAAARLDVADGTAFQACVDATVKEHGRLDYLFNNAGIAFGAEIRDMTLDRWRRILDVNVLGVVNGVQAAYPLMIHQGGGHIVNTASVAGVMPHPSMGAYVTTKHAVVGLSRVLRAEAADLGVKVSVLCPGCIQTAIWDVSEIINADRAGFMSLIPFRMMSAEDFAAAALRGVERNVFFIATPFHARALWWLTRLSPELVQWATRRMVKDTRRFRKEA